MNNLHRVWKAVRFGAVAVLSTYALLQIARQVPNGIELLASIGGAGSVYCMLKSLLK